MKKSCFAFLALIPLVLSAQELSLPPRVIRVTEETNSGNLLLAISEDAKTRVIHTSDVTNEVIHLNLHHGDLIVFDAFPGIAETPAKKALDWLAKHSSSNKVALYVFPGSQRSDGSPSIPIYHWVAPFSNPRTLLKAAFFYEGRLLGTRTNGLNMMLSQIALSRPRKILILGSLYDFNSGFGPFERPYENQQAIVDEALAKTHTQLLTASPLVGF